MTADTVGGVWTYSMDLISILADAGIHVHLFTSGVPLSNAQRDEVADRKNLTLYESGFKLEWMDHPWHDIEFSGWQLLEMERRLKPDLIHLNSYSYASLPFKSPVIVVAHSDVFSWWFSVRKSLPGPEWQEYFRRVKEGIRAADCVVAPSQSMMGMLGAIYGTPADARVIYNARDVAKCEVVPKQNVVMSAGRLWDEAKNIRQLAYASDRIKAPVKIAGELKLIDEYAKFDNIRLLGKLNGTDVREEMASSLIYAAPARYEPFGLCILEAAMCGCALVLGNIPSLKELWKDNALYVDTDNAEALASTCNRLLDNPELAIEYGNRAKAHSTVYALEKMGAHYVELYDELVKTSQSLRTVQIA